MAGRLRTRLPAFIAAGVLLCAVAVAVALGATMIASGTGGGLTTVEQQQTVLTLGAPAGNLDHAAVDHVADQVASQSRLLAPDGARKSPAWPLEHTYVGDGRLVLTVSLLSSVTAYVTLSKRPSDARDHAELVRRITTAFAPMGFKPAQE